jgi:Xaa-Pro dipeptidase
LAECETVLRPGYTAGEVFEAHARVMDANGMAAHRLNACGYSLGARFTPSWMDTPMFYRGNSFVLGADMVFFAHMILMDSETGTAMTLGRTYIVTEHAPEPLSAAPLDLLRR